MKIKINNLGPIENGTVDLNNRLIIFTGPNNTGKSYLTYLIHGISQYSELTGFNAVRDSIIKLFSGIDSVSKCIKHSKEIDLKSLLLENVPQLVQLIAEATQNNLPKIFASQIKASIEIEPGTVRFNDGTDYIKSFSSRNKVLNITTFGGNKSTQPIRNPYKSIEELMMNSLYVFTLLSVENMVGKRTYFFPAERTAINLFAKHITSTKAEIKDELDADLIAGMSDDELGKRLRAQVKAAPKYPYAIREYINFVNNFKPSTEEGEFAEIANNMEVALTGGKVHLDQFDQLVFTPKGSAGPLELHLSSSLVKSLSYLILYLRYTAKKGDQVIIDEPELNLHPDLQITLARFIAQMVNGGLKVIISTHSDYLIKQLNNLILLGELADDEQHSEFVQGQEYVTNDLLIKAQVGAYFLSEGGIHPIDLAEGLVVPTINDAIRRVDGLAEELFIETEG